MQIIAEVMKLDPSLFSNSRTSTRQSGGASAVANLLAMAILIALTGGSFAAVHFFLSNPAAIAISGISTCDSSGQLPSWLLSTTGLAVRTCTQRQADFDAFMASIVGRAQLAAGTVGGIGVGAYTTLADKIDRMLTTSPTATPLLLQANAASKGGKRKNRNRKTLHRKSRNRMSRKNKMNRK